MTQTIVTYNEVELYGCLTREIPMEPLMDDSGTDKICDRFKVRVSGMCHGLSISSGSPAAGSPHIYPATGTFDDDASQNHRNIRHRLSQPRRDFSIRMGTQTLLEASPFPVTGPAAASATPSYSYHDMNNGPKPKVLSITNAHANNLFRIEFEIEVCILRCDDDQEPDNNSHVVSNRWSVMDEIDRDMMTLRVWQGRLRISSGQINPQSFRGYVVPILQKGFVRQQMRFVASTDGLHLDYQIVDKEVAFSAPHPATSWEFSRTLTGSDAATLNMDATVRLRGDRKTSKQQLIQLAMQIIDAKLRISRRNINAGNGAENFLRVEGFVISDVYGSDANEISVSVKVAMSNTIGDALANGANVAVNAYRGMGVPISARDIQSYDFNLSRGANLSPELSGPIPLTAAFHAYLRSSCENAHGYGEPEGQLVPELEYAGQEQQRHEIEAYESPAEEFDDVQGDSYLTPEHNSNPYSYYRVYNEYPSYQGKVQFPIARSASQSASETATCVVLQVCQPIVKRIIRVSAERNGIPPELPAAVPEFTDENNIVHTLLDWTPMPDAPHRDMAGGTIHSLSAQYIYALSRNPSPQERLRVGMLPWDAQARDRITIAMNDSFNLEHV